MSNVFNIEMIIYDLYLSSKRDLLLYPFFSKREYANLLCYAIPIKTTTHPTPSRYAIHNNNPSSSTILSRPTVLSCTLQLNTPTPPLQPLIPTPNPPQHLPHLLQTNIAPNHPKRTHSPSRQNRHAQPQFHKPLPFAPRHILAPHFTRTRTTTQPACRGLNARATGEGDVLVVGHVEVACVGVVDDV